jgi:2-hydroxy-6-oxonona-2,4-dienedioate hydrolase
MERRPLLGQMIVPPLSRRAKFEVDELSQDVARVAWRWCMGCTSPAEIGTLIVGGLDIRVRRMGCGQPVVLVHGLGVSSRYFGPLADRLSGQMRVIAPDLPGWGGSDRPVVALDIGSAADALTEIIGEKLDSPTLVANSLGCQFVIELALRRPDLVGALVLISPTVDPRYRSPARQALTLAVDWTREPAGLWPIIVRDYWAMGPRRLVASALLALGDRIEDKLPRLTAPVLVLRGDRDAITTRNWAESCARFAPDGRFVAIRGATHAAHFSHPEQVARLVLSFVSELADHRR